MVQNKIGRPRQFDETAAIAAAVEVFWLKGFEATSLDDLTAAMGINRPSLYAAFGDKKALFLNALGHYAQTFGMPTIIAFQRENEAEQAVRAYFTILISIQARPGEVAKGCLLASCATSSICQFPGVQEFLSKAAAATLDELEVGFERLKRAGKLHEDFPSRIKAKLMLDVTYGFAYRARLGADLNELMLDVESKCSQVLMWQPSAYH